MASIPLLDKERKPLYDIYGKPLYVDSGGTVYQLSWVQSPSVSATAQTVMGTINGNLTILVGLLPMSISSIEYAFTPGDVIDWYIKTMGRKAGESIDSAHNNFLVVKEKDP